ncbi:MAG: M1 family aminopeptidase [Flavobacteriales bacterium]
MSHSGRFLLFLGAFILYTSAFAQPYKYGCHYFRQHPSAPPIATAADRALIDDIIARSDTFDILHYDIAIDVTDYAGQQIKAATTITFTPLMADQNFIRFELLGLEVDSVISDAGPLTYANDGQTLRVDFLTSPGLGSVDSLTVYYHGHPHRDTDWGGFYFESGYIYNLGIGLTTIPPNFGKVWYPCFDSFVERATYSYQVKSAGTFRAHCQGDFLGEVQLGGDTVIRSFRLDQRIPTHLSAIAVADYRDTNFVHAGANGDIPVRLTAKPAQLQAMVGKFADIGAAIDACEYWFGPYAWQRVGYVLTTDGALEIPTNIAYPDFMTSQTLFQNRGLFTHELGHHWWGDMVTPHTQQDMWLKEGPAEYSGHLVEEWLGGESAFVDVVKDNQLYVLKQANVQDGGFQPLSPMPDPYIYGLTTYYKGASVMHNMRGYMGDSLFRQGMHEVQQVHAYETLDAAGFRDALEASTGYDLHPFFTDQVFAPGFSVFVVHEMETQQSGTEWEVNLSIKQKLRGTTVFHQQVPLDITLLGAEGQQQEYRQVVSGEFSDIPLSCAFEPVLAVLNRYNRLNQARMDYERTIVPEAFLPNQQPRVDFRLYLDQVLDTAMVRMEHIWAAPDQTPLASGIDMISDTHYWIVDGLWPTGTELHARLTYTALSPSSLDHGMLGADETGVLLLYRASPSQPWEAYPDQTVHAGVLTDGSGYIDIDILRKGEYAFGKGMDPAGISSIDGHGNSLNVYPVPASDHIRVDGLDSPKELIRFTLFNATGGVVLTTSRSAVAEGSTRIDVSHLASGTYILGAEAVSGTWSGRTKFMISR